MLNRFCKRPLYEVTQTLARVAMGAEPAELVIRNARLVNVCTAHRQIVFAHTAKRTRRFFKGNSITCIFACQHEVMKFSKIF